MQDKNNFNSTTVITIDGPSGSGKGTISQQLAKKKAFHYLDSGAMYRVVSYAILKHKFELNENTQHKLIDDFVLSLDVEFLPNIDGGAVVLLNNENISDKIRTEEHGVITSKYAQIQSLRKALLLWQRSMAKSPGLVADGRDMGTVVFPDADFKVFLMASAEERAKRRYKQLKNKGINVNLSALIDELKRRDQQDANRKHSPLIAADDALSIDSTYLSIDEVMLSIENYIANTLPI